MKLYILLIVVFLFAATAYGFRMKSVDPCCDISELIEWIGWPIFAQEYQGIDPGFYGENPPPTQFYRDDIEIGLRPDGVVVWRKIKAKEE